ncbi:VWA domain-containing protein [Mucilaginibacter jinjuensis]|uniref:VWA domain-containing protein n=1 Tax=Mucilaginibacter jinjuensis TaxID=1176721 RepID=A0ABY7T0L7_9SPHI|nr:VWA domain-containing protein [Mucilaginibacter jinjuensis]WCT09977.1 VWA domain-containing protein [Mucilaginibacter jinjuensis]
METYWHDLKNIITHIDWKEFHFLRFRALYLFVPLSVIVLLLIVSNHERRKWKTMVASPLRQYMFSKGSHWAIIMPMLLFIIGVSCMIIGLAGPTWKKKEIPGQKIQAVVLIALDLSRSMMVKDVDPNRIERAKFKIIDFLDANPRARAGLVAFAGTAHPVLPFTGDYKIIKFHSQSLSNKIMPVQGSNIPVLLREVDTLMKHVTAPSTLLLMTDAIDTDDAALLSNWVDKSIHRLEILLVSTPNGASIPGYPKVISKQDPSVLQNLSQDTKITITNLTLDNSDVKGIADRVSKKLYFESEKKKDAKEWDDMGYLMLLPALAICLFWFRRGWTIQWCVLIFATLSLSSCGLKSRNPDWWYTKDYQGQMLENNGKYAEAADRFEDDKYKAVAYYKAGNYEAAADLFALDSSAAGNYNRGLALTRLGRYDAAEDAFKNAINLDPSLKIQVAKSLEATKNIKHKADSIARFDGQSVTNKFGDKQIASKKKHKDDPLKEHKPQSEDEKLSADTRVKNMPKFGDRTSDEVASNIHIAKESKSPGKGTPPDRSGQLPSNILLRRAAADPGEFLHKRFLLQEKLYYRNVKKSKTPW